MVPFDIQRPSEDIWAEYRQELERQLREGRVREEYEEDCCVNAEESSLIAALERLYAELRAAMVPEPYAIRVGFRGVDRMREVLGESAYLYPLPDDPKWEKNQRGEAVGFKLLEEAP